ncbi:Homoserine dehydrogenase [Coemansia sp. RSA 1821]|nr:homoserine dehydrogenase-domain-containing protein [Coemansia mojavensis]KAJ1738700.1 Homoserine dehydrogenase [Coemansia sp. RSA 1086]KAJ1750884.1 Homoserine dehydrogenase [Coemansia sp. RSA 1821]KAJ2650571.1 Homoserine dehydrogenase [Coemansia sp. RSA 1250]KAJ2671852.1 Homoserine dehydrogenase [Coemansia sp. RSA 1085]
MLNVAIVGPGLVGSALIEQLVAHSRSPRFASLPIAVVGIINSKKMAVSSTPFAVGDLGEWKSRILGDSASAADLGQFADQVSALKGPTAVVDCTSSDTVAELYPHWLSKGLHVVTPNKKAFSGDISLFRKIQELTTPQGPSVYHEATVGAGLPVLSTLNDLVRTGDKIIKIEGIFSGTLSYLFNNFSVPGATQKFSECVSVAKASGYTEPDPRDDLNGMDVARKVTILGRVAGQDLALDTLPVENIVPDALRSVSSADEFMSRLPEFDEHFKKLNDEALASGSVLRYVGMVDGVGGQSSVKLARYPLDHPFASLKGSDNIIAFTTERFSNPLIVQGAGAGAAVTAFGIFADLIKACERFGVSS